MYDMKKIMSMVLLVVSLLFSSSLAEETLVGSSVAPSYIPYSFFDNSSINPYDSFDYVAPVSCKALKHGFSSAFLEAETKFSYEKINNTCYMDICLNPPYSFAFLEENLNASFVFDGLEEHRKTGCNILQSFGDSTKLVFNIVTSDGYLVERYSDSGWSSYFNGDFAKIQHVPAGEKEFSSSLVLDSYYIQNLSSFIQKMIVSKTNVTGSAVLDGFYDDETNACVLRVELTEDYASYSKETIDKITDMLYQSLQEAKRLLEQANVYTNNTVITCDYNGVIIHHMRNGIVNTPESCGLGHYVKRTSSNRKCEVCSCALERWPKLTAKEAMYNYTNSKGKSFHLKGHGELCNYYNYGYDDYEDDYFCLQVIPEEGKISERWYVYFKRSTFSDLFNLALSNERIKVEMECNINEYERGQSNMAKAVYAKWWN